LKAGLPIAATSGDVVRSAFAPAGTGLSPITGATEEFRKLALGLNPGQSYESAISDAMRRAR
jgi:hypothetical protein